MNDEELLEAMEQRESYMLLYRFQNCVKNMLKAKQKKETWIPRSWLDSFYTPSITCEYSIEQCDKMLEIRVDLVRLAYELGLELRD